MALQEGLELRHPVESPTPSGMLGPPFQNRFPDMTRSTSALTVLGSLTAWE